MHDECEVIVFDVCGTLYNCNTTAEFCKFLCKTRSEKMLLWFVSTKIGRLINRLVYKISGAEFSRSIWLRVLEGKSSSYLEDMADEFVTHILKDKEIAQTHVLVKQFKEENLMLASASIEPVVRSISKLLKIDRYIASQLKYESGICLGQLSVDLLGNKHYLFGSMKINKVITDNKSDIALCLLAKNSIIVSRPRNVSFWNKHLNNIEAMVIL